MMQTIFIPRRGTPLFDDSKSSMVLHNRLADDVLEWLNVNVGENKHAKRPIPFKSSLQFQPPPEPGYWEVVWAVATEEGQNLHHDWVAVRLGTDDPALAVYFKLRWG